MNTPAISKPLLVPTPQSCERPGSVERNMPIDFTRVRRTAVILILGFIGVLFVVVSNLHRGSGLYR
jgi:hypothetical protein